MKLFQYFLLWMKIFLAWYNTIKLYFPFHLPNLLPVYTAPRLIPPLGFIRDLQPQWLPPCTFSEKGTHRKERAREMCWSPRVSQSGDRSNYEGRGSRQQDRKIDTWELFSSHEENKEEGNWARKSWRRALARSPARYCRGVEFRVFLVRRAKRRHRRIKIYIFWILCFRNMISLICNATSEFWSVTLCHVSKQKMKLCFNASYITDCYFKRDFLWFKMPNLVLTVDWN